jgi:hypothetical protein
LQDLAAGLHTQLTDPWLPSELTTLKKVADMVYRQKEHLTNVDRMK